jgi:hypothetical protein
LKVFTKFHEIQTNFDILSYKDRISFVKNKIKKKNDIENTCLDILVAEKILSTKNTKEN